MSDGRIHFEEDHKGRVRPVIVGGNGEVQARLEWYDNHSNATRGVADLFATLASLMLDAQEPEDSAA